MGINYSRDQLAVSLELPKLVGLTSNALNNMLQEGAAIVEAEAELVGLQLLPEQVVPEQELQGHRLLLLMLLFTLLADGISISQIC